MLVMEVLHMVRAARGGLVWRRHPARPDAQLHGLVCVG